MTLKTMSINFPITFIIVDFGEGKLHFEHCIFYISKFHLVECVGQWCYLYTPVVIMKGRGGEMELDLNY